jgi:hypothetical protein
MVFQTEALLQTREEFLAQGKPVRVDIGYHYTRPENMSKIRTDGLLTKSERDTKGIQSHHHGSAYGDGVYTADNPALYSDGRYGSLGLMVARLQGTTSKTHSVSGSSGKESYDTYVSPAMTVLSRSSQCLAMMEFPAFLIVSNHQVTQQYHSDLQQMSGLYLVLSIYLLR